MVELKFNFSAANGLLLWAQGQEEMDGRGDTCWMAPADWALQPPGEPRNGLLKTLVQT